MADTTYSSDPVFRAISTRLRSLPRKIDLGQHIKRVIKVGGDAGVGITFEPQDYHALIWALDDTKAFAKDDRGDFFGALASADTTGLGMRQTGLTSVHWKIAPDACNVHIDTWGFVMKDADGNVYYSPDAVQHIVDDLMWVKIAEWVGDKLGSRKAYLMLRKVQPVVPNSSNRYQELGVRLKLTEREDKNLQQKFSIVVDFTTSCLSTAPDRNWTVELKAEYRW